MAIHISPHKAKEDDRGMVIVGGALALGVHTGQAVTVDDDGDVLDEELRFEEDSATHSHSGAPHACTSACCVPPDAPLDCVASMTRLIRASPGMWRRIRIRQPVSLLYEFDSTGRFQVAAVQ